MGPALVAVLISHLGRTAAFNYSAAGWIPCGLLLLATGEPRLAWRGVSKSMPCPACSAGRAICPQWWLAAHTVGRLY